MSDRCSIYLLYNRCTSAKFSSMYIYSDIYEYIIMYICIHHMWFLPYELYLLCGLRISHPSSSFFFTSQMYLKHNMYVYMRILYAIYL